MCSWIDQSDCKAYFADTNVAYLLVIAKHMPTYSGDYNLGSVPDHESYLASS